jgi:hypothetical protein
VPSNQSVVNHRENDSQRKWWTISRKIYGLSLVVLLGILAITVTLYYTHSLIREDIQENQRLTATNIEIVKQNQKSMSLANSVQDLRLAVQGLSLAVFQGISQRENGELSKAQAARIDKFSKLATGILAQLSKDLTVEEHLALLGKMEPQIKELIKIGKVDLAAFITQSRDKQAKIQAELQGMLTAVQKVDTDLEELLPLVESAVASAVFNKTVDASSENYIKEQLAGLKLLIRSAQLGILKMISNPVIDQKARDDFQSMTMILAEDTQAPLLTLNRVMVEDYDKKALESFTQTLKMLQDIAENKVLAILELVAAEKAAIKSAIGKFEQRINESNTELEKSITTMTGSIAQTVDNGAKAQNQANTKLNASGDRMSASLDNSDRIIGAVCIVSLLLVLANFAVVMRMNRELRALVDGLRHSSSQAMSSSVVLDNTSHHLASSASQQAAALEETTATVEEMAASTKQDAENAANASQISLETSKVVDQANQTVRDLQESMDRITSASKETGKIIKSIDEIAFQTNLLALNAAVEAARAGEAGAGFAVVANEVRDLAIRAAKAAGSTSQLLEENIALVGEGSKLVNKTGEAFETVESGAGKLVGIMAEIAESTKEQAVGFDQVTNTINEMDRLTQQNAASAETSADAAEALTHEAEATQGYSQKLAIMVYGRDFTAEKADEDMDGESEEDGTKLLPLDDV